MGRRKKYNDHDSDTSNEIKSNWKDKIRKKYGLDKPSEEPTATATTATPADATSPTTPEKRMRRRERRKFRDGKNKFSNT